MDRTNLLWIGIVALLPSGAARAGVEPSPFQPELNKLSSVEHVLEKAGVHLVDAIGYFESGLAHPPEPGLTGRVAAISLRAGVVDSRVAALLTELHPPEPGSPVSEDAREVLAALDAVQAKDEDLFAAFDSVLTVTESLVDRIDTWSADIGTCGLTTAECACQDACDAAFDECMAAALDDAGVADEMAAALCRGALESCAGSCMVGAGS